MNQKNFKIQGFLQNKLIAEINLDQLKQFQVQDQGNNNQRSVLLQQREQSRDNILNKVKVIYNRPKFEVDYNLCLLSYEIKNLPEVSLNLVQQIEKKQEQRKKYYDDKISLIQNLQSNNDQQSEIKNQGYFFNKKNDSQFDYQDNDNNQANQIYQFNPNNNNKLYGSFKGQQSNMDMSKMYFSNKSIVEDVIKFQKETGCDFATCQKYIQENGSFEQAIKKYEEEINNFN